MLHNLLQEPEIAGISVIKKLYISAYNLQLNNYDQTNIKRRNKIIVTLYQDFSLMKIRMHPAIASIIFGYHTPMNGLTNPLIASDCPAIEKI